MMFYHYSENVKKDAWHLISHVYGHTVYGIEPGAPNSVKINPLLWLHKKYLHHTVS